MHVSREQRLDGGPLFRLPTTGGPWNETSLRRWWYRACDAAGVPQIGVYEGTKHSLGTELRREGVPLNVIQAVFGHDDASSTERYARLADTAVIASLNPRKRKQ